MSAFSLLISPALSYDTLSQTYRTFRYLEYYISTLFESWLHLDAHNRSGYTIPVTYSISS